ncbi:TlpA family protein disulfide reductase [Shewanella cyperi]|uniref:TlpA family protein disulfide reductase n=1 Tax=Shewanella cyperi TaxID=2814292 RepID=UPI00389994FD
MKYLLSLVFVFLSLTSVQAYPGMGQEKAKSPSTVDFIKQLPEAYPIDPIPFKDELGRAIDFSRYKGKLLLVNMWATWCSPCVRELPALARLSEKFPTDSFQLLPISIDAEGQSLVKPFLTDLGLSNFTTYYDKEQALGQVFPLDTIPATYILNTAGELIAYVRSYVDWEDERVLALVDRLIKEQVPRPPLR